MMRLIDRQTIVTGPGLVRPKPRSTRYKHS
jgi:hypothetical protein